jgi:hypothetical protein
MVLGLFFWCVKLSQYEGGLGVFASCMYVCMDGWIDGWMIR